MGFENINSWKKPDELNPTLDEVKKNYLLWIEMARYRVNQELSQVLRPDPLQTLSSAFDHTENRWKLSPMDSLKAVIAFLELNIPEEDDFVFKKLYKDTLANIQEIYTITLEAVTIEMLDSSPVERIYDIAQLKYGTVVIQARLDMIVRLALLELLDRSPEEDQVLVAQLLAAERFTETITKMSGTDNLALIRADINRAQPITIANLSSFMDTFGDNINRILKKLWKEEKKSDVTVARSKRYARTEMCHLLLSVPRAHEQLDTRYCEGLKFTSIAPGGPETEVISRETFRKDLNDRACVYREFFRQSKIFETWSIKWP